MESKFSNYLFRCSELGNIISKSGKMTDGIKTYLQECFLAVIYGKTKEAYGIPLEKGILTEEDSVSILQNLYPEQLLITNKERKDNLFITGRCDVFKGNIVNEIKSAYTLFTFYKADLSWRYLWQTKGYCWLWQVTKGRLFYCLNNMPEQMLQEEERMLFYKNKWAYTTMEDPAYIKACDELRAAHTYDKMPIYERFKVWDITLTEEDKELIAVSVQAARKYLDELWLAHLEMIYKNKGLLKIDPLKQ